MSAPVAIFEEATEGRAEKEEKGPVMALRRFPNFRTSLEPLVLLYSAWSEYTGITGEVRFPRSGPDNPENFVAPMSSFRFHDAERFYDSVEK